MVLKTGLNVAGHPLSGTFTISFFDGINEFLMIDKNTFYKRATQFDRIGVNDSGQQLDLLHGNAPARGFLPLR